MDYFYTDEIVVEQFGELLLRQFYTKFGTCLFFVHDIGLCMRLKNNQHDYDLSDLTPEEVRSLIEQSLKKGKDLLLGKVKNKEVKIIEGAIY